MFEHVANAFLSLNILGLGAYITMTALFIGIGREVSNGKMKTFMLTNIILNFLAATIMLGLTKEAAYYLISAIILVIIYLMPNGVKEMIIEKRE